MLAGYPNARSWLLDAITLVEFFESGFFGGNMVQQVAGTAGAGGVESHTDLTRGAEINPATQSLTTIDPTNELAALGAGIDEALVFGSATEKTVSDLRTVIPDPVAGFTPQDPAKLAQLIEQKLNIKIQERFDSFGWKPEFGSVHDAFRDSIRTIDVSDMRGATFLAMLVDDKEPTLKAVSVGSKDGPPSITGREPGAEVEVLSAEAFGATAYSLERIGRHLAQLAPYVKSDGTLDTSKPVVIGFSRGTEQQSVEVDFNRGTVEPPIVLDNKELSTAEIKAVLELFVSKRFDGEALLVHEGNGLVVNEAVAEPKQSWVALAPESHPWYGYVEMHEAAHALFEYMPEYREVMIDQARAAPREIQLDAAVMLLGFSYDLLTREPEYFVDEGFNGWLIGNNYNPETRTGMYQLEWMREGLGITFESGPLKDAFTNEPEKWVPPHWSSLDAAAVRDTASLKSDYEEVRAVEPTLTERQYIERNLAAVFNQSTDLKAISWLVERAAPETWARANKVVDRIP